MTETIDHRNGAPVAITPDSKVMPKRNGPRGLVPSTWVSRSVKIEYVGAGGDGRETTAILLDWCPVGLLLNIAGAKTLLSFDRLVLLELVED